MFEFRKIAALPTRAPWLASAVLHVCVTLVVVAIAWRVRPRTTFITLSPPAVRAMPALPPRGGSERGRGPSGGLGHPMPRTAAPHTQANPAPIGTVDSSLAVNSSTVGRHM